MKYCQGPLCHTYETQDRIRGPKGAKTYQTRRASKFSYLGGNACTMICQDDWFRKFGARALDHFGRITEPKKLVPENAWGNRRDWGDNTRFYAYNRITKEERPITEQQYYDNSFTLNQG